MQARIIIGMLMLTLGGFATAEQSASPGFATCAAFYFLAARGHGIKEYDSLYSAGEFSLNEAIKRHGKPAADQKMEHASTEMMREIHQDWRDIAILDARYGDRCDTLLRDADHPR